MRHYIDLLLIDIWRDPAQKRALTRLAAEATSAAVSESVAAGDVAGDDLPHTGGGALLVDYARAMLNSLMYMLGVRRQPSRMQKHKSFSRFHRLRWSLLYFTRCELLLLAPHLFKAP